jgi:hypothetical protein
MKKIIIIASCLMMFVAISTHAQHTRINQRERHQHTRIHQGVANGEITRHEAQRLRFEQHGIRKTERVAKADGHVSPREHMRIQRIQNHASRDIYRQKHDIQHRQNSL